MSRRIRISGRRFMTQGGIAANYVGQPGGSDGVAADPGNEDADANMDSGPTDGDGSDMEYEADGDSEAAASEEHADAGHNPGSGNDGEDDSGVSTEEEGGFDYEESVHRVFAHPGVQAFVEEELEHARGNSDGSPGLGFAGLMVGAGANNQGDAGPLAAGGGNQDPPAPPNQADNEQGAALVDSAYLDYLIQQVQDEWNPEQDFMEDLNYEYSAPPMPTATNADKTKNHSAEQAGVILEWEQREYVIVKHVRMVNCNLANCGIEFKKNWDFDVVLPNSNR